MERKTTTKAISGYRSQKERKAVWIAVPIAIAPRLLLRSKCVGDQDSERKCEQV